MSDRDFTPPDPTYAPEVHLEVARDCLKCWKDGRPWTRIRVLEKGVDDPSGHSCVNSHNNFHIPCDKKIKAVQYNSAFGEPQFYCEEHALCQVDWDVAMYDGERPTYDDIPDAAPAETMDVLLKKGRKKKEKEPEPEYDPS